MEDNVNNPLSQSEDTQKKHLSKSVQLLLILTGCVLSCIYATGILGAIGFPLMLIAVAMNVLPALEFEKSKVKLIAVLCINFIPFAVSAVYFKSVIPALAALYVPVMVMAVLFTLKAGLGRAATVGAAAIGATVIWCVGLVISVVGEYGAFNAETLGALLDSIFDPYAEYFMSLSSGEEAAALPITSADIEAMRYYFKTMFFGSTAMAMIIWSYFVTLAVRLVSKVFGVTWRLPSSFRVGIRAVITESGPKVELIRDTVLWRIQLDSVSAGVYIASYAAAILFSSSSGVPLTAFTVAVNLILILSPGFLYCGLRDIILGFRRKSTSGALGYISLALMLAMMFISPMVTLIMLCALGVIVTLRENFARRNSEKTGKE